MSRSAILRYLGASVVVAMALAGLALVPLLRTNLASVAVTLPMLSAAMDSSGSTSSSNLDKILLAAKLPLCSNGPLSCAPASQSDLRASEWLQLARLAAVNADYNLSGKALGFAGVTDYLTANPQAIARLDLTAEAKSQLSNSFVAAAQDALAVNQPEQVLQLTNLARLLTPFDAKLLSSAYMATSQAHQQLADMTAAFSDTRTALDILPPRSLQDERLLRLYEQAGVIAQHHECQYNPAVTLPMAVALYSAQYTSLPTECIATLAATWRSVLPADLQQYVLLRLASVYTHRNQIQEAQDSLLDAVDSGLSPAWELGLFDTRLTHATDALYPPVALDDTEFCGYDVDPIQIELGLPLDLLLFRCDDASLGQPQVLLHTAINLAPNPGFEYDSELALTTTTPAFAQGFRYDMYEPAGNTLSPVTHRIETINRPLEPGPVAEPIASRVLSLGAGLSPTAPISTTANSSTSLVSFPRIIDHSARYLEAGWMRVENGNGFFGHEWWSNDQPANHAYVAVESGNTDWQHFAQVVQPPAQAIERVALWLINYSSAGVAQFDNIILVQLPD